MSTRRIFLKNNRQFSKCFLWFLTRLSGFHKTFDTYRRILTGSPRLENNDENQTNKNDEKNGKSGNAALFGKGDYPSRDPVDGVGDLCKEARGEVVSLA